MKQTVFSKKSIITQYLFSLSSVLLVSLLCWFFESVVGYRVAALVLLMNISILAMLFDIKPVLIAASLSALIWNFFFIPPLFTLAIDSAEDVMLFLLYFLIALVNTVLSSKIKKIELKAREKEKKEKELKLYNTLLNSLSHELRTPVATIIGNSDLLKDHSLKLSTAEKNDLAEEINVAALRLNKQIENLLNISRIESGHLQPKFDWTDLQDLCYSILQKMPVSVQSRVRITSADNLPIFKIDSGFTEQIIYNLLQNAVLYTPEGSPIHLDLSNDKFNCIISISDHGKGFPEKELKYVFEKFYRLHHQVAGGTGLGLSIVKGFTEAQNGIVSLHNLAQGGAQFVIKIPAQQSCLNNTNND